MFGRRLKSKLPMLPSQRENINKVGADKNKDNLAQHMDYFNIWTKPLNYFEPGDLVTAITGKWDMLVAISSRRPDNMSYITAIGDKKYTRKKIIEISEFI